MNILLIDDDPGTLESLAYILDSNQHSCRLFTVPEQAVESYRRVVYDAVITDMKMPGLDGIQVLRQIRSVNPEAKVVILSACWDADAAVAAVNYGAYAFLIKPVRISDLIDALDRIESGKRDLELCSDRPD